MERQQIGRKVVSHVGAFFNAIVLARFAGRRVQGKHWGRRNKERFGSSVVLGAGYGFNVRRAASAAVSMLSTA